MLISEANLLKSSCPTNIIIRLMSCCQESDTGVTDVQGYTNNKLHMTGATLVHLGLLFLHCTLTNLTLATENVEKNTCQMIMSKK